MASALAVLLCGGWFVSPASAMTIATFADPAADSSTSLFELDGDQFAGSWDGTGLTLETPVLPAPDFENVTFDMPPVQVVDQATGLLGPGLISFFEPGNDVDPIFTIAFESARLLDIFGFGASDLVAEGNVTFGGSIVPAPFQDEFFAFSFANFEATQNGFTVTSAFTSSAVPDPSTVALLLFGAGVGLVSLPRH